ncbi:hypothetical protein N779_03360 [Vibrio coralliilyticus OCN008]|nr:hypothetical protein N779_03360 [Vibrio coralliilyticus OCN008]
MKEQYDKLNWLDVKLTNFDLSKLENVPLEKHLIFKLIISFISGRDIKCKKPANHFAGF